MENLKLKVYIASKFHSRNRLMPMRKKLEDLGFEVLSNWMLNDPDVDSSSLNDSLANNLEQNQMMAERDEVEVDACHIFIIDTNDESATGGREVELGHARNAHKICYRVGPIRNVFHSLVEGFASWEVLLKRLEDIYGKRPQAN